jgi:hypothetical protein
MNEKKSLGFMFLAKRPCGRVAAMCWDDPRYKKDTLQHIDEYLMDGYTVERVERFEGDPMYETICRPVCTDCRKPLTEQPLESETP